MEQEQNHENKDPGEDTPRVSNNIVEYSAVDQCLQNRNCVQDVVTSGDSLSSSEMINCRKSNDSFAQVGKFDSDICSLPQNSTLSEVTTQVKVEYSDGVQHSMGGGTNGSSGADDPAISVKNEISDHIAYDHLRDHIAYDHLDHIVLKERQIILFSRCCFNCYMIIPPAQGCAFVLTAFVDRYPPTLLVRILYLVCGSYNSHI